MTKVYDFCLIGELGLLVAGGIDNQLRVFLVNVLEEESGVSLKMNSSVTKESNHRVIQIFFDKKRHLLMCLSADNKIEAFAVNVDKPDSILKKLQRQEKKHLAKSLKRTHTEANLEIEESKQVPEKIELENRIEKRDYEFSIHFSKKTTWVVDP